MLRYYIHGYSPYLTIFRLGFHVVVLDFCVVRTGFEPVLSYLNAALSRVSAIFTFLASNQFRHLTKIKTNGVLLHQDTRLTTTYVRHVPQ